MHSLPTLISPLFIVFHQEQDFWYNLRMRNWSIDVSRLDKNSDQYIIWHLEQLINYGLGNEKIDSKQLKKYLPQLTLDPAKQEFIQLLLDND